MRLPVLFFTLVVACGDNATAPLSAIAFTKQTDWMHESNPVAAQALADLAQREHWQMIVTDDPAVFSTSQLLYTDVVIFSVTSGDVLEDEQRANLQAFLERGGGFVGIHSASHTEWDWPFYLSTVVPVQFFTHPTPMNVQPGALTIEDPTDPIVAELPDPWMRSDEFYSFYTRPEDIPGLHMLLALDESSVGPEYNVPKIGYHPLAFSHELTGGRSFYTALGHTPESYSEPAFMRMIQRAIEWAAPRR